MAVTLFIALIFCFYFCYKMRRSCQNKRVIGSYDRMGKGHANDTKAASHTTNRHDERDGHTNRDQSIEDETQPPDTNNVPSSEQNYNKDTLASATTKLQNERCLYPNLNDPPENGISENKSEQTSDDEGRGTNDIPPKSQTVDETSNDSRHLDHVSLVNCKLIETDKEQCREDSPIIDDDFNKPNESAVDNPIDNVGVINKPNEGSDVIDKPNEGDEVIEKANEDAGVIDRPNEGDGVIDRPNEEVGVINKPNERMDVINISNEGVSAIDTKINVQVYMSQGTANVVKKAYEELLSKLVLEPGLKVVYTSVQDFASANPDDPLLIMCVNASRLRTDAKNALKGLLHPKTAALVILHYKDERALPQTRSDHVLVDPIFETIAGIIDFAYLAERGMYSCKMNTTCIRELEEFIRNFKKIL